MSVTVFDPLFVSTLTAGWVGRTKYFTRCSPCFDKLERKARKQLVALGFSYFDIGNKF